MDMLKELIRRHAEVRWSVSEFMFEGVDVPLSVVVSVNIGGHKVCQAREVSSLSPAYVFESIQEDMFHRLEQHIRHALDKGFKENSWT